MTAEDLALEIHPILIDITKSLDNATFDIINKIDYLNPSQHFQDVKDKVKQYRSTRTGLVELVNYLISLKTPPKNTNLTDSAENFRNGYSDWSDLT